MGLEGSRDSNRLTVAEIRTTVGNTTFVPGFDAQSKR